MADKVHSTALPDAETGQQGAINEWTEIEPCIFQRRPFTPEEMAKWDKRPDDLINKALGR